MKIQLAALLSTFRFACVLRFSWEEKERKRNEEEKR